MGVSHDFHRGRRMNTIYRIVWNAATGTWVVASELARGRRKTSMRATAIATVAMLGLSLGGPAAFAQTVGDSCRMPSGTAGVVDETGFCISNAAGDMMGTQSVGTMATVDDAYLKVNGSQASASNGTATIAIGRNAQSNAAGSATGNIALGYNARNANTGAGAVVMGRGATIQGTGGNASVTAAGTIAIGNSSNVYGTGLALGASATVAHTNGTVIGGGASNSGSAAILLGANTRATGSVGGSIAVGYGSAVTRANTLSFGTAASTRQLVNMSAGTSSNDAVTMEQLAPLAGALGMSINPSTGALAAPAYTVDGTTVNSAGAAVTNLDGRVTATTTDVTHLATQLGNGTVGLVQQNVVQDVTVAASTGGGIVDITGTEGARILHGVADGELSTTSTQAVTGAQLDATRTQVTQNTNQIAALNTRTTNLDHRVTTNTTGISQLQSQLEDGTVGLVQQNAPGGVIAVAAGIGGGAVNLTGTGGARSLAGVADGDVSTTSTDVVTGRQLNAINTQVTTNTSDLATLHNSVTSLDGRVTSNTGNISTLQQQIGEGTVGLVQQNAMGAITVAAATGGSIVNLAGADGTRRLSGVANGTLSDTSDELVNGAQVNDTDTQAAKNTTALDTITTTVTNLDNRVTTSTTTLSELQHGLANGTVGLVQQGADGNLAVAGQTDGSGVVMSGADGARTLTGMAGGRADTDAANVAQIKASGIDPTDGTVSVIRYDDLSLASARLGGLNGTVIDNLGAGRIAAGSLQAINGGQLYDLQQNFQGQFDALTGQVGQLNDRVIVVEQGLADGSIGGPGNGGVIGGPGTGDNSLVVGEGANASGGNSAAVGNGAVASGDNGSAIGNGAVASGNAGTAIGSGASASADNAVALGAGSAADRANSVSVGSVGNERQVTNVAAGTASTDAVNVQQLTDMRNWAQSYTDGRMNAIDSKIGMVGRRANAGTAAAIAMANMPQGYAPGQKAFSMGVGTFAGENALAAGLTTISPNGRWVFRTSLSADSQGDAGVGFSAGMAW
jgi:hypothetical protein